MYWSFYEDLLKKDFDGLKKMKTSGLQGKQHSVADTGLGVRRPGMSPSFLHPRELYGPQQTTLYLTWFSHWYRVGIRLDIL